MEENKLIDIFCRTIKDPLLDTLEVGADLLTENEIIKSLPIIKYVSTAYNIIDDVKWRYNINKLAKFLKELHNNNLTNIEIDEYKNKLNNEKFFNGQLEYSLILLDRYIDFDKVEILGRLFYLHIDGKITWLEYKKYGEILDRLLPTDLEEFIKKYGNYDYEEVNDSILRLVSSGLLVETTDTSSFIDDGLGGISITSLSMDKVKNRNKTYKLTNFGRKFIEILLELQ